MKTKLVRDLCSRVVLLVVAAPGVLTGCGDAAFSDEGIEEVDAQQDSLYQTPAGTGSLWPVSADGAYKIPVCLRCNETIEPGEACDDAKASVQRILESNYERYTRIDFQGFEDCPLGQGYNIGKMRISIMDEGSGTTYRDYRDANGVLHRDWSPGYAPGWEMHLSSNKNSGVMLHEVGHSLGFMHEYLRNDGVGITCDSGGEDLNLLYAPGIKISPEYDPLSIMNETYCRANFSGLSPRDIVGLQTTYGRPWSGSLVNNSSGECLTHTTDPSFLAVGTLPLDTQGCRGIGSQNWRYGDNDVSEELSFRTTSFNTPHDTLKAVPHNWEVQVSRGSAPTLTTHRWRFTGAQIKGLGNLCLAASNSPVDGENLNVVKCDGVALGQQWEITGSGRSGYYTIKSSANTALCLRSSSADGSSRMRVTSCTEAPSYLRQFKLGYGTGALMIAKSDTSTQHVCVEVNNATPDYDQAAVGTPCTGAASQEWFISGKLKNDSYGTCITADSETGEVGMDTCDQDRGQKWEYYP